MGASSPAGSAWKAKLIDAIGGEDEALAWLEAERDLAEDLEIRTVWPPPEQGFRPAGTFLNGQARAALGLPEGPITLDGLVSLWQVGSRLLRE